MIRQNQRCARWFFALRWIALKNESSDGLNNRGRLLFLRLYFFSAVVCSEHPNRFPLFAMLAVDKDNCIRNPK